MTRHLLHGLLLVALVMPSALFAKEKRPRFQPPAGSSQQSETEARLEAIDLSSDDIQLVPFKAGCSIVLRVQERYFKRKRERWRDIGVMKTRSGFTYLQSEVGYYRLGKFLDFDVFPVTVYRELDRGAIEKLLVEVAGRTFPEECKEKARVKLIGELVALLAPPPEGTEEKQEEELKLQVILKEWIPSFHHLPSKGFAGLPPEVDFNEYLTLAGTQPPDKVIEFQGRQRSKSSRRFAARTDVRTMVRDIANLMVLDAVASQYDRWGGHNLHFRLVDGSRFEKGDDGVRRGGMARLLALDNGSAMRSETTKAFDHLKAHVHRYDRKFINRLRQLGTWMEKEPHRARDWLGLPRFEFRNLRRNLKTVLDHIDQDTEGHPERWFDS